LSIGSLYRWLAPTGIVNRAMVEPRGQNHGSKVTAWSDLGRAANREGHLIGHDRVSRA